MIASASACVGRVVNRALQRAVVIIAADHNEAIFAEPDDLDKVRHIGDQPAIYAAHLYPDTRSAG